MRMEFVSVEKVLLGMDAVIACWKKDSIDLLLACVFVSYYTNWQWIICTLGNPRSLGASAGRKCSD